MSDPFDFEAQLAERLADPEWVAKWGTKQQPRQATAEQWDELMAAIERKDARLAADMPTEKDALNVMFSAWERLKQLGWREAIYCPKDGTAFEAIEAGSTGIFRCHYDGKWPEGHWWAEDGGDLWPSRPILFRSIPETGKA